MAKEEKATRKELRGMLMAITADATPNRFNVTFGSDDGGTHAVVMVERDEGEDCNGRSPFQIWPDRPHRLMGWRVLYLHTPAGYIDVFYNADGKPRVTASE